MFLLKKALPLALLICCAAVVAPTPCWSGDCLSAQIAEPIEMPDGALYEPGRIQICHVRTFTPGTVVHSASMDGDSAGLFFAKRIDALGEGEDATGPYLVLTRRNGEPLRLEGFGFATSEGRRYFEASSIGRPRVLTHGQFGEIAEVQVETSLLVAAMAN